MRAVQTLFSLFLLLVGSASSGQALLAPGKYQIHGQLICTAEEIHLEVGPGTQSARTFKLTNTPTWLREYCDAWVEIGVKLFPAKDQGIFLGHVPLRIRPDSSDKTYQEIK